MYNQFMGEIENVGCPLFFCEMKTKISLPPLNPGEPHLVYSFYPLFVLSYEDF